MNRRIVIDIKRRKVFVLSANGAACASVDMPNPEDMAKTHWPRLLAMMVRDARAAYQNLMRSAGCL